MGQWDGWRRASLGAGLVAMVVAGCQCEDGTRALKIKDDLAVSVGGGVSCAGESVRLGVIVSGGTAPFAFQWEPAEGLDDPTAQAPLARGDATRTYTVTVTDGNFLVSTGTATVERRALATATVKFSAGGAAVCQGTAVRLDATGSMGGDGKLIDSFEWDPGEGATAFGAVSPDFVPVDGQVATLRLRDADGCVTEWKQEFRVRAPPTPRVAFASGSAQVCDGGSIALDAGASVDADGGPVSAFAWDLDGDPATVESDQATTPAFTVASGAPTPRVTVVDAQGCRATAEQPLEVLPLPVPTARLLAGPGEVCEGRGVAVDGGDSRDAFGAPVAAYAWSVAPSTTPFSTDRATTFTPPAGVSDVVLTVTDARGCSASATQPVVARPAPRPALSFVAGSANVCLGDDVVLSAAGSRDADGNPVSSYEWDIDGDGTVDGRGPQTPGFAPATPRTVRLTVADAQGCVAAAEQPVAPRALPTGSLAFDAGASSVCAGETVAIVASIRDADGRAPASYGWDVDGNPATVESTGAATGSYRPTGAPAVLRVADANGCRAIFVQPVTVRALPTPRLTFRQGSASVCAGAMVTLDASTSTDSAGAPVAAYTWDFGDGTTGGGARPAPLTIDQSRTVRLSVTDSRGCVGTLSQPIAARAHPRPVVSFVQGAADACAGEPIALSAAGSADADGQPITRFAWDLDSDGAVEATAAQTPAFVPPRAQTATLKVTDAQGCSETITQPLAPHALPQVHFSFGTGGSAVCDGDTVSLEAAVLDANGQPPASYAWDLDGDPSTVESTSASTGPFRPAGAPAVLTVADAHGCTARAAQPIAVRPLPTPRIGFAAGAANVCRGDLVALDGTGSTDADGQPVASYRWELGDGTQDASARPAPFAVADPRTVRLAVVDAQGCSAALVQPIAARALPAAAIRFVQGGSDACAGSSIVLSGDGSVDADGLPISRFAWDLDGDGTVDSTAAQTLPYSPPAAQTAVLKVVDAQGCSATATQALAPRALPDIRFWFETGSAGMCAGSTVSLGVQVTDANGNPPATYAWDLDGDSSTVESTSASTGPFQPTGAPAVLVVTDAQGCQSGFVQPIAVRPLPTARVAFVQGSANVCSGAQVALDGSASRDADGAPVAAYAWDLGDGTRATAARPPALTVDAARTVRLTVTDAQGCVGAVAQPIAARALPTPAISFVRGAADACSGSALVLSGAGSADADGQPITRFAWDLSSDGTVDATGAQTAPFTPPAAQTATLKVVDAQGCSAVATQPLAPRPLPRISLAFDAGGAGVCAGATVSLSASVTDANGNPPASFAWDLDGNPATIESSGPVSGPFQPAGAPASLTVVDVAGCRSTLSQPIAVRPLPTARIAFAQGSAAVCSGAQVAFDGADSADADGRPVAAYRWDFGDGTTGTASATPPLSVATSRTVRLTVQDAQGCAATASQPVAARALPSPAISFVQGGADACSGSSLVLSGAGSLDADGRPVTQYAWDLDGNGSVDTTAAQTLPFVPPAAQTATLKVVDAQGCSATAAQPLAPRALPQVRFAFDSGSAGVCAGTTVSLSAAATDANGNPPASYAWDLDGNPATIESAAASTGTFAPSGLPAALTVTDAQGCRSTYSQPIAVHALPTARIAFSQGAAAVCAGTAVAVSGSASTDASGRPVLRYAWDLDGVAATVESTAAQPAPWTADGSRVVRLTVWDANGCAGDASAATQAWALPTPAISFAQGRPDVCLGDAVALSGAGSRDASGNPVRAWAWNLGDSPATLLSTPETGAFVPTAARTVALRVTDALGCSAETSAAVAPRALPTARIAFAAGRANVCLGDSVTLSGTASTDAAGAPVASYRWDYSGATGAAGPTATFAPAASETVQLEVTDAAGCRASATQALAPRALPTARIAFASGAASMCAGSTVQLDGSGSRDADGAAPASYAWTGALVSSLASPPAFAPATSQAASLRVTDLWGCQSETSQALAVRPLPTPRIAFAQGSSSPCAGSSVQLDGAASTDAAGAPVSSYSWDLDGDPRTVESTVVRPAAFAPPASTTARLTVTDSAGCSASLSQALSVRPVPTVTAGAAGARVCAGGSVTLGGAPQPGVSYLWSPAAGLSSATASNPTATPAATTRYTVTGTNAEGCSASASADVTVLPLPVADAGPDRQTTDNGSVQLLGSASGGTPGYAYAWTPTTGLDNPAIAQPRVAITRTTPYTLQVTDANGCRGTDTANVNVVPSLAVTAGTNRLFCLDSNRPLTLNATVTGGVGAVSVRWTSTPDCGACISSPASATTGVRPAQATTFTVTAVDANGTTASASVDVTVQATLLVDAGADRAIQRGETTQLGTAGASGLTYSWVCNTSACGLSDPSVPNPLATPPATTTYLLTATDGDTCTATDAVTVKTDPSVVAVFPLVTTNYWCRDQQLWALFDGQIDPATLASNVKVLDPSDGRYIWSTIGYDPTYHMVSVKPLDACPSGSCNGDHGYMNNKPYLLVFKGGPGGIATPGPEVTHLYNDTTLAFTASSMGCGSFPRPLYQQPAPAETGVPQTTQVVVKFDVPLDPRSVNAATLYIQGVASSIHYDLRTFTATLRPLATLAPGTTYTVVVSNVLDSAGNAGATTWSFTTGGTPDTAAPTVVAAVPPNGSTNVDLETSPRLVFSEPVDPTTIGRARVIDLSTGYPVEGTLLYDAQTRTATVSLRSYLEPNHQYRFDATGVRDQSGNPVTFQSTFTSGPALLAQRLEAGTPGWTLSGPWGSDYQAAWAGLYGLSDSPGGGYAAGTVSATTPPFSVAGRSQVNLTMRHRRTLATDGDAVTLETSWDGATWTPVATLVGIAGWTRDTWTLPVTGGPNMRVRLRLVGNSTVNLDGYFVDEVVVQ